MPLSKYGLVWPDGTDPVQIEIYMIKKGGRFVIGNVLYGLGLYFHYRTLQAFLWPEDDIHRWSDLAQKNICENGITVLMGPGDCVSGDTEIFDPTTGESTPIESLCRNSKAPMVMTLNGPELAEVPYLKGRDVLYEVACDNGSSFKATSKHRVLTVTGFSYVSSLRIGEPLPSYAPIHPGSISESFREAQMQDGRHCFGKLPNFRFDYHASHRFCDAQPRNASKAFPKKLRQLAGVQIHNDSRNGGFHNKSLYNQLHAQLCHLSTLDLIFQNEKLSHPLSTLDDQERRGHDASPSQPLWKSLKEKNCETPYLKSEPHFSRSETVNNLSSKTWDHVTKIVSIKQLGVHDFYDIHVPIAHHYFAQGLIHHNSNKTYSAAKWALSDYWVDPSNTCTLVSSTDVRGLELRVWGTIKDLFNRARDRYPYLAGFPIESMHAITTDDVEDSDRARVLKRGIIGIPCLQGGQFVGLGKYVGIKQKRVRLIADECFPAGTLIDTPTGQRPIETLKPGDSILSAAGADTVVAASSRIAEQLFTVHSKDGRSITCTGNHPFLTQKGWISACNLNQSHYVVSAYEAMQVLQTGDGQQNFLQQILRREIRNPESGSKEAVLLAQSSGENWSIKNCDVSKPTRVEEGVQCSNEKEQPNDFAEGQKKIQRHPEGNGVETSLSRREWNGANEAGTAIDENDSRGKMEPRGKNGDAPRKRIPRLLQAGHRNSGTEAWNRSRWEQSLSCQPKGEGREEGFPAEGSWVDHVEIFQQANNECGKSNSDNERNRVYNLQVEKHPSYSVNGLLVHNCQLMGISFLDAISNLMGNVDFKAVLMGNPLDQMDPLGKAGEPEGGWDSMPEPEKTSVWKTRFNNGVCVNFVGTDSPNFDFPRDKPIRYPYMISWRKIDAVAAFWGMDSLQYYSQCKGVMKKGLLAHRVITKDLCRINNAYGPVIWKGGARTQIFALDAAYSGEGGDRCVGGKIEFGEAVDGTMTILVHTPVIVPVSLKDDRLPETQIAQWVKDYLTSNNIPVQNAGYDSTGRGTLGSAFAAVFGSQIPTPIEFGGCATNRPVRHDLYIEDKLPNGGTKKRLKKCDEHYKKFVTELWFSVRYVIECDQMRGLPMDVCEEGCMREYGISAGNLIEIESKIDTKERMGRSPDLFDWLATAVEMARRAGFQIKRLGSDVLVEQSERDNWARDMAEKHLALVRSKSIHHIGQGDAPKPRWRR